MRLQAERGSPGDRDNGFHLKGRREPEQRTAGVPAPGQVVVAAAWGPAGRPGRERASGRKAAGGVVWAAGPGNRLEWWGAKVTGRLRPPGAKLKAGRRPDFLSASRSLKGKKPFPRGFSLSGPRVGASDLFVPCRNPSWPP